MVGLLDEKGGGGFGYRHAIQYGDVPEENVHSARNDEVMFSTFVVARGMRGPERFIQHTPEVGAAPTVVVVGCSVVPTAIAGL